MPLRNLFKRQDPAAEPPPAAAADDDALVQAARAQARRRLIGAVVLLAIGVIVFPLLFDSKPRPVPGDVRIELQRSVGVVAEAPQASAAARPVTLPPSVSEGPVEEAAPASASSVAAPATQTPTAPTPPVEAATPAKTAAAPTPTPTPAAPSAGTSSGKAGKPEPPPRREKVAVPTSSPAPNGEPGAASAAVTAARFVVQVGAFTDPVAIRETRQRVEKLGLKTYTQVIENDAGKRTRVRVGPFETRAEAEAAGTKIKAAGLPAYLLSL